MKTVNQSLLSALLSVLLMGVASAPALAQEAASPAATSALPTAPALTEYDARISLNNATAEELVQRLSGIGMKKAQAIVQYREQHGPFSALEQLREVPGIGEKLYERLLPQLKL